METCKIKNLYNLNETAAKELFEGAEYPWEVLPKIGDFIRKLGETLREEEYEKRGEDVWVAKSAKVAPTAYPRSCDYWKRGGGTPLCVYPWKCTGGRRSRCGKFHRAEKCDSL